MTKSMSSTRVYCLFCLVFLAASLAVSQAHGQDGGDPGGGDQGGGDRMLVAFDSSLWSADLPRGDFAAQRTLQDFPEAIAYGPDGRLFALGLQAPPITAPPDVVLYTIGDGGETVHVAVTGINPSERILDMAFAPDGRLYALTFGIGIGDPPDFVKLLYELDPENGAIIGIDIVAQGVEAVATSKRGLWLLERDRVLVLDSQTDNVTESGFSLGVPGAITSAATDSTGAVWFISRPGNIDPVPSVLRRFDPATGSAILVDSFLVPFGPLAVEQRCQNSETHRCLLGGRFRARVEWLDFDDRLGHGRVAPSGSADSTLFWFFEPSNWELLVKMVDGCDENGHFWVFAAGTTNVAHALEVTDLATGETFLTINRLGQASPAVTATDAFDGCDL